MRLCRTRVGVLAALALNALWIPYLGFEHDAALYALQVSQRAFDGMFASDLFLKFGSQDSWSAFSTVMAPVVKALGVEAAFFLVFMIAQTALFAGIWSLYRALFRNRAIVGLAMMFVAMIPIRYGGFGTFAINESFLTARTLAYAFSLFAMAGLVRGRWWQATALVTAGLVMHPIIAFPVLLTLAFCVAQRLLTPKALLALMAVGLAAFLVSLMVPALGNSWYGQMDDAWREIVRAGTPYCFPELWPLADWERLLFVIMLGLAGALWAGKNEFPFFAGLLLVSLVGITLSIAAPHLPYALTIQAQTYRYAWPLYLLAAPLGMDAVRRTWRSDSFWLRLAALALFTYLFFAGDQIWRPIAWLVCLAAILSKIISGRLERWHAGVLMAVMLIPGAFFSAYWTSQVLIQAAGVDMFLRGANIWRRDLQIAAGSGLCLILGWLLLSALARVLPSRKAFGWACGLAFITLQVTAFALVRVPWCGAYGPQRQADVEFVQQTVQARAAVSPTLGGPLPTIHWPTRNPWETWFEVGACSYFTANQIGGELFFRETAMEVRRRARLAAPFDVPYLTQRMPVALRREWVHDVYVVTPPAANESGNRKYPAASVGDLLMLSADPALDFAILPVEMDGWSTASNGRWFVYDCREIRAILLATYAELNDEDRQRIWGPGVHSVRKAAGPAQKMR